MLVVTVNDRLVAPLGIVTLLGTVAALLLLEMATTAPPAGAAALSVTVPCEVSPPLTDVGFKVRLESVAAGVAVGVAIGVAVGVGVVGVGVGVALGVAVGVGVGCADALTPKVTVFVAPPAVPEMITVVLLCTLLVVTLKLADWAPAGTVTLAGTFATDVLLLESVTTVPPPGASALIDTVPCDVLPPVTVAGNTSMA